MQKILIKIGSSSIFENNKLLKKNIINLIKEVCTLKQKYYVCLIVSGAKVSFLQYIDSVSPSNSNINNKISTEMYSAGQVFLTNYIFNICKRYNKMLSFMLISNNDLNDNKEHICNRINNIIKSEDTILCLNGNDSTCTDGHKLNNDFLAKQINDHIKFDHVFFLSSVSGVLDAEKKVIKVLNKKSINKVCFFKKTNVGVGGMEEKISDCKEIAKMGSKCYIISAFKKNSISKILAGKKIGTVIDF